MKIGGNNLNLAVDALSAGLMASLVMTGLLAPDWRDAEPWIVVVFLVVLAFHVVRHWSWVESMRRKLLHLPQRRSRMHRG